MKTRKIDLERCPLCRAKVDYIEYGCIYVTRVNDGEWTETSGVEDVYGLDDKIQCTKCDAEWSDEDELEKAWEEKQ